MLNSINNEMKNQSDSLAQAGYLINGDRKVDAMAKKIIIAIEDNTALCYNSHNMSMLFFDGNE